jgi:transcriptional regulator with XRE-family HTH domain
LPTLVDRTARRLARQREIAQLIKLARASAGLSQEDLARRMTAMGETTHRSQVSMWEMGPPHGQAPTIWKFLAVLEACETGEEAELLDEILALQRRLRSLRRHTPPRTRD